MEPSTYHHHSSHKYWHCHIYFELFDLAINCIENCFDHPDFKTYSHSQEILLNAVKGKRCKNSYNAVTNFLETELNESSLSTHLKLLQNIATSLESEKLVLVMPAKKAISGKSLTTRKN